MPRKPLNQQLLVRRDVEALKLIFSSLLSTFDVRAFDTFTPSKLCHLCHFTQSNSAIILQCQTLKNVIFKNARHFYFTKPQCQTLPLSSPAGRGGADVERSGGGAWLRSAAESGRRCRERPDPARPVRPTAGRRSTSPETRQTRPEPGDPTRPAAAARTTQLRPPSCPARRWSATGRRSVASRNKFRGLNREKLF